MSPQDMRLEVRLFSFHLMKQVMDLIVVVEGLAVQVRVWQFETRWTPADVG